MTEAGGQRHGGLFEQQHAFRFVSIPDVALPLGWILGRVDGIPESLTEIGRRYYDSCCAILAEADAAEALAQELSTTARGRLLASAPVTFGACCLARSSPGSSKNIPRLKSSCG